MNLHSPSTIVEIDPEIDDKPRWVVCNVCNGRGKIYSSTCEYLLLTATCWHCAGECGLYRFGIIERGSD